MTNGEHQAVNIANKYVGYISEMDKLKHLGEEYAEFIEACLTKSEDDIYEEASDMIYLILHIISKRLPPDRINMSTMVVNASDKMEYRFNQKH